MDTVPGTTQGTVQAKRLVRRRQQRRRETDGSSAGAVYGAHAHQPGTRPFRFFPLAWIILFRWTWTFLFGVMILFRHVLRKWPAMILIFVFQPKSAFLF